MTLVLQWGLHLYNLLLLYYSLFVKKYSAVLQLRETAV